MLVVLIVILIVNVSVSSAVRCYNCRSREYPSVCGSEFKLTPQNDSYIVDNCDTCHKYLDKSTNEIIRNCTFKGSTSFKVSFGCKKETQNGHVTERCTCTKELCNGAQHNAISENLLLAMTLISVIYDVSECLRVL